MSRIRLVLMAVAAAGRPLGRRHNRQGTARFSRAARARADRITAAACKHNAIREERPDADRRSGRSGRPARRVAVGAGDLRVGHGSFPSLAEGGFFDEGDMLPRMESRLYEPAVTRARATIEQVRLRSVTQSAEEELARKEWDAVGRGDQSPLLFRKPQIAEAESSVKAT